MITVSLCYCAAANAGKVCDSLMRINQADGKTAYKLTEMLEECKREAGGKQLGQYCAKALNLYAWYLIQDNSRVDCSKLLSDALQYCPESSGRLYYEILSGLAGTYMYNKEYDKAEKTFLKVLDYHRRHKNEKEQMIIYANLGTFYKKTNNSVKSLYYYQKALGIAGKKRIYDEYYCHLLIFVANLKEDSHLTPDMIHKSIDIAFRNNFTNIQASNFIALAEYYCRQSDYVKALSNADKAMQYAKRTEYIPDMLECYQLLGKIYNFKGDYELASSSFRQLHDAREKFENERKLKDYKDQTETYNLLQWCHDNMNTTRSESSGIGLYAAIIALVAATAGATYAFAMRKSKHNVEKEQCDTSKTDADNNTETDGERERMRAEIKFLTLFYNNQNALLERIKNMLRQVKGGTPEQAMQLKRINNYITQSMLQEWGSEFAHKTEKDDTEFLERLSARHPELTDSEKKFALFMRMELSSRDIALLTGNQLNSIKMSRYRLRKTLRLSSEEDLTKYLQSI